MTEFISMARNLPLSTKRTVHRFAPQGYSDVYDSSHLGDAIDLGDSKIFTHDTDAFMEETEDSVVTEYVLTVHVNNQEMATVVCSPEHMDDLVLGFLAAEGVIRSLQQVKSLVVHTHSGRARVETTSTVNFNQEFFNKRYIASCCGKSRQSFYFYNDVQTAKRVDDQTTLTPLQILTLMDAMEVDAGLFRETGGVHIAALCDAKGVIVSRSDIGRHNALDKLYGYVLRKELALTGKVVTFSGRLSSEVLLKVAKLGTGMVIARSAPTALALDIAEELNITTVGFARNRSFNVYTHPWRVAQ